jgi:hypothetical protein
MQKPGRLHMNSALDLLIRNGEEGLDEDLVLQDDGRQRIGVVPDLDGGSDSPKSCVRELLLYGFGRGCINVLAKLLIEVYGERRRLDVRRHVDDLLQTWHTKRDVVRRHTSTMEGVERHLRGQLSDRLRSKRTAQRRPG